jgi:hypothetical protein
VSSTELSAVLFHIRKTAPFENGDIKLTLRELEYIERNGVTGPTEITPVVEGAWEPKWEFNYADTSKTVEVKKPLSSTM